MLGQDTVYTACSCREKPPINSVTSPHAAFLSENKLCAFLLTLLIPFSFFPSYSVASFPLLFSSWHLLSSFFLFFFLSFDGLVSPLCVLLSLQSAL